jgi:hypothetical protein
MVSPLAMLAIAAGVALAARAKGHADPPVGPGMTTDEIGRFWALWLARIDDTRIPAQLDGYATQLDALGVAELATLARRKAESIRRDTVVKHGTPIKVAGISSRVWI